MWLRKFFVFTCVHILTQVRVIIICCQQTMVWLGTYNLATYVAPGSNDGIKLQMFMVFNGQSQYSLKWKSLVLLVYGNCKTTAKVARTSFRGEVKPSVPCRRFTTCKRILQSMNEMLCRPDFPNPISRRWFSRFATRWLWLLNQGD
jgi:hypothetical protein